MDLTQKSVSPFDGELVKNDETVESVVAKVESTIEEPAQIVELALDKYIVNYLLEEAKGYESESPLYNFSLTMNESIYLQLEGQVDDEEATDISLSDESQKLMEALEVASDKLYNEHLQKEKVNGLMGADYVQMKIVLAKQLYALLLQFAQKKGMDMAEAIHECMYQYIYLDKFYSRSAVEEELSKQHNN